MQTGWMPALPWLLAAGIAGGSSASRAQESTSAGTQTPTAGEARATACSRYADAFCAVVGESSGYCSSMRTSVQFLPERACRTAQREIESVEERMEELRASCTDLANRLCADIGEDTESCRLVREQTPRFDAERCVTMLAQYDDVLRDLQRMEARNGPVPDDVWADLLAGAPPSVGPAAARVVVVLFTDFLCPYCKTASATLQAVRQRYGSVVRFVVRQFPLAMHGPNARLAAQAALAAHAQGKFWALSELLFVEQDRLREDGRAAVEELAEQVGLDMVAFRRALDNETFEDQVAADLALGERASIDGTPTFLLDARRASLDPRSLESFEEALDEALTAAGVAIPPEPPARQAPAAAPSAATP